MPDMPPLERGAYLINYLFQIGPVMAAGMGAGPITHGELLAWQENVGVDLKPWEISFLRRLSGEYLVESHKAEKRGAQAPWLPADAKPEVSDTQRAIRVLANL